MKAFLVFAVILAVAVAEMHEMMGEQFKKECMDQEKVDASELEKVRSGQLDNPSEKLKCFNRCMFEKGGFFKDGMFVDEKVKEFLNKHTQKEHMLTAYEDCKKIKGTNDCDTTFKVFECMHKAHMP
uniref:Uncharacterized protein n=1 Tax=Megaselia scalaris TaxID=36166 RepID=T1GMW4_MEGSC